MRFAKPARTRIHLLTRRLLAVALCVATAVTCSPLSAFADAQSDLASATAQLEQIGSDYQKLQEQLVSSTAEVEDTKSLIEEKHTELTEKQAELAGHVSSEYKTGGASVIKLLLDSTTFNDILERVFYMDKVSAAQAATIKSVRDLKAELERKQVEQEQKLAEIQQQVDDLAANQKKAQSLVNSLSAEVKQQLEEQAKNNAAVASGMESSNDAANGAAKVPVDGDGSTNNNTADKSGGNVTPPAPNPAPVPTPTPAPAPDPSGGKTTISSPIGYALAQEGAAYVSGGRSPSVGFDCSGLVWYAYRCIGITLPSTTSGGQEMYFRTHGRFTTNVNELQYGDVVFFSGHVAFYVGGGKIFGARTFGKGAGTSDMRYFGSFHGGGQLYR
ncbi:NLP/P60 protein [Coriobacterium glomerans PW2]|uniref:NLP/P60 protein n=1 Tax=Coriobacterium glomerans (strain ATCC 49209 / DSM 20642 / JCM 10262 / PW2) TaxID=700015 RepID=F2N7W3_CORGP|nr:C40 family peptidase [Coriobacterium glomerans]AEB07072.1 NLP/P60 protein [Coriobacterium glomerans PW2]